MKILYPINITVFDVMSDYDKTEAEKAGEEMICEIQYLENLNKAIFSDPKKRVKNNYILNKAEYPRTITSVKILLLKYQPKYRSNRQYQSQGVRKQLMFTQREKYGDDGVKVKENKKNAKKP